MKYKLLNKKHNEYLIRHEQWLDSLMKAAVDLRTQIINHLESPADWEAEGKKHAYVYLIQIPREGATETPKKLVANDLYANEDGVFPFGVAITFQPDSGGFPKSVLYQNVGVRSINKELQYCLWNRDEGAPHKDGDWVKSLDGAVEMVVGSFEKFFEFDPALDFAARPKLGFM